MATYNTPTARPDDGSPLDAQRLVDAGSWFVRQGLSELESAVADLSPELDLLVWSHLAESVPIDKAASDARLTRDEADEQLQSALESVAQTLHHRGWGDLSANDVAELLRIAGALADKRAKAETQEATLSTQIQGHILSALRPEDNAERTDSRDIVFAGQLAAVALPIGRGGAMETFAVTPDPVSPHSGRFQLIDAYEDDIVQVAKQLGKGGSHCLRLVDTSGRFSEISFFGLHDVRDAGVFDLPHQARAAETSIAVGPEVVEGESAEVSVLYELPFEHGTLVFAQRGGDLLIRIDPGDLGSTQ